LDPAPGPETPPGQCADRPSWFGSDHAASRLGPSPPWMDFRTAGGWHPRLVRGRGPSGARLYGAPPSHTVTTRRSSMTAAPAAATQAAARTAATVPAATPTVAATGTVAMAPAATPTAAPTAAVTTAKATTGPSTTTRTTAARPLSSSWGRRSSTTTHQSGTS